MNIPLIPDKSYKLLVYLGIGLIIYAWISRFKEIEKYEKKRIEYNVEIRKIKNQRKYLDEDLTEINKRAEILSKRNSLENPLKISDSGYVFTRIIKGNQVDLTLSDSIGKLLDSYNIKSKQIRIKNDELDVKKYEIESLSKSVDDIDDFAMWLSIFGATLFWIGTAIWVNKEEYEGLILQRNNLHLPTFSERCQSCGTKFNSMNKYGTENNDTDKNYHFCLTCYQKGKFTEKNLTLEELIESKTKELNDKKKSKVYIKRYLKIIRLLDRWKQ